MTSFACRFFRRGQSGQSIVILALAFVALLAFVGIVTDISLLFVRYSTLQRAVDSASVAAATQFRRILNTQAAEASGWDVGLSTSYTQMSLAARSFIEGYGLDPDDVAVETCQVQLTPYDEGTGEWLFDANPWFSADDAAERHAQLCTADQRKLVRVTARMAVPTVFMRVLGIQDFPLIVDSISETAVLDVMLILDVSESMLSATVPETFPTELNNIRNELLLDPDTAADVDTLVGDPGIWETRYLPGRVPIFEYSAFDPITGDPTLRSPTHHWWQSDLGDLPDWGDTTTGLMGMTQDQIDGWLENDAAEYYDVALDPNLETGTLQTFRYYVQHRPFLVGQTFPDVAFALDRVYDPDDADQPRYECRVRFWPFAHRSAPIPDEALEEYIDYLGSGARAREYFNMPSSLPVDPDDDEVRSLYMTYRGFAPAYNFYGCCNDPNGDGNFIDLVCQPFKQARDETVNFLDRIDFLRGDRVGFVTFDRRAYLFDVNGSDTPGGFMIDNQEQAELILQNSIGVRSEASFYADEEDGDDIVDGDGNVLVPRWDRFVKGSLDSGTPDDFSDDIPDTVTLDYRRGNLHYYSSTPVGEMSYFPLLNNCPFDMAALIYPFSNHDPGLLDGISQPSWFTDNPFSDSGRYMLWSYDRRGSCAGTNVGASLAQASQALGTPVDQGGGRTEGAVWIMVLLSDGAAGASNPVARNAVSPRLTRPYLTDAGGDPAPNDQRRGEYGAFGLCPYAPSITAGQTELTDPDDGQAVFPYCSDELPQTRQFCQAPETAMIDGIRNNPNLLDLANEVSCNYYDVDDYARDWADYVSGITLPSGTSAQLPTIFTIGFGLTFDGCGSCVEEVLGEELLRYVADVGDNNRMDSDYWQRVLGSGVEPAILDEDPDNAPTEADRARIYGQLGPCEDDDGDPLAYQSIARGESCGNYFNAAGGAQLEVVFNEIASRMFTRLSQ